MRSEEFIEKLISAGWQATSDAQYTRIKELWAELYPTIAAMENEIEGLESDISCYIDAL